MPGVAGSSGTCGFGPSVSVTFEYSRPDHACGFKCCAPAPTHPLCSPPCPRPQPKSQCPPASQPKPNCVCPTAYCGSRCPNPAAAPLPTIQPIQIWGCTPHVCCPLQKPCPHH